MTTRYLRDQLRELLEELIAAQTDPDDPAHFLSGGVDEVTAVWDLDQASVCLMAEGLMIGTRDGDQFRVIILRAR